MEVGAAVARLTTCDIAGICDGVETSRRGVSTVSHKRESRVGEVETEPTISNVLAVWNDWWV